MKKYKKDSVFWISVAVTMIIIVYGILDVNQLTLAADQMILFINTYFSRTYLIIVFLFVVFCLVLALSPFGRIKLGPDHSVPEYSNVSWFAMLFCAGMGIGLVFWGISEPLSHYVSPANGIAGGTTEAAAFSIRSCFMHWGIHPWVIYSIIGLGLAYAQFRKNQPALISSLFIPLLGEKRMRGMLGKMIDIFSIIVTVAGVATSLGMACLQVCSGLNFLYGIPDTKQVWIAVIIIVSFIYLASALSGLDKGIKLLSNINLYLAVILLAICFLIGPSGEIVMRFFRGTVDYVCHFVQDSLYLSSDGDNSWIYNWRIFYWAWWIAWAPFVGIFIARISKGRTIREFLAGVVLVPSAASLVWFSIFGGMSLHTAAEYTLEELEKMAASPETALYIILNHYPFGKILCAAALILLLIFLITSAESATMVLGELSSDGNLNPPAKKKLIWGILLAAVAMILVLSGGVKPLQNASVAASLPFLFIMFFSCISLLKGLWEDWKDKKRSA